MRKEELVKALLKTADSRSNSTHPQSSPKSQQSKKSINTNKASSRKRTGTQRRIRKLQEKLSTLKNLAAQQTKQNSGESTQDRLVVMVRDPYWLHAFWELSQRSVDRAQAAMGQRWHTAQPTLRVYRILGAGTASLEKDITIHGGVSNWYVDVQDPTSTFRMEVGYLAEDGSFYCLARSNSVQTPPTVSNEAIDKNWADVAENADQIYAMSGGYSPNGTSRELQELLEERLRRPLGTPMHTRYGSGASGSLQGESLPFAVDAELVIPGATSPQAHVTLQGTPVQLREDGTFSVKFTLPDQRQVIPIVASSNDGFAQRTIILAVERNTKKMEPVHRDLTKGATHNTYPLS